MTSSPGAEQLDFQVPPVSSYVDGQGRAFQYIHVHHQGGTGLAVHFSAFFGPWGEYKQYRATFSGYFHRLRMLGSDRRRSWLFLCDAYGPFGNGTYYTGEKGDLFVERAMLSILDKVMDEESVAAKDVVMVGSSMGGTAALKFGLRRGVRGIAAVCPHVDLDTCARLQNRAVEVSFICPDGDPLSDRNFPYTRQIRTLLQDTGMKTPPRLYLQACADDRGLYLEQIVPLVSEWRGRGGAVDLDVRPVGGHTSDYATRPLLLDAVDRLASGDPIDVAAYQTQDLYRGELTRLTLRQWGRRKAGQTRARLQGSRRP